MTSARPLDATPYGVALATAVAAKLDAGARLAYRHRDTCGMGLAAYQGRYVYLIVDDGWVEIEQFATWPHFRTRDDERVFDRRDDFIAWLAAQSDESLRGAGNMRDNQRITRARLREFVDAG